MAKPPQVLLLTIGTGNANDREASLFNPVRKSIGHGKWARVVLLPSSITRTLAQQLQAENLAPSLSVEPLPRRDDENDADRCFDHFDRVLTRLLDEGFEPAEIHIDFTRGTKAMSAALVLAAHRHRIHQLRYIAGPRDERGQVVAGQERVHPFTTYRVNEQRTIDLAVDLLERGQFAAVDRLLPQPGTLGSHLGSTDYLASADWLQRTASFYAAWDRHDYGEAARRGAAGDLTSAPPHSKWKRFHASRRVIAWVRELACPRPEDRKEQARHVGRLAVDMIANGERRLRDRQFEDAILRAYRAVELVGQAALFLHGYDSAAMPADDPAVQAFLDKLAKNKNTALPTRDKHGNWQFAREQVARFLKSLDDQIGPELLAIASPQSLLTKRNKSLLIHGFDILGAGDLPGLEHLYKQLPGLVAHLPGLRVPDLLKLARTPNFQTT